MLESRIIELEQELEEQKNMWRFSTGLDVGEDTVEIQAYAACSAAANGDILRIQQMLKHGVDIHHCDYDKRSSLHLSSERGKTDVVEFLIKVGAPLIVYDIFGNTPLSLAIKYGHYDIAFILEGAIESQEKRTLETEYYKYPYINDSQDKKSSITTSETKSLITSQTTVYDYDNEDIITPILTESISTKKNKVKSHKHVKTKSTVKRIKETLSKYKKENKDEIDYEDIVGKDLTVKFGVVNGKLRG